MEIEYTINRASEKTILDHFLQADQQFVPPLSTKVDLEKYAHKIWSHAVRFEAWNHDELIGLIAVYINDSARETAFITSVSVKPGYERKGIATRLLRDCLDAARKSSFKKVTLEVSTDNIDALALYRKFDFEQDGVAKGKVQMMSRYL